MGPVRAPYRLISMSVRAPCHLISVPVRALCRLISGPVRAPCRLLCVPPNRFTVSFLNYGKRLVTGKKILKSQQVGGAETFTVMTTAEQNGCSNDDSGYRVNDGLYYCCIAAS